MKNKKNDPEKPWVPTGSENRVDIFTDFKFFDLNFEYDNDLT